MSALKELKEKEERIGHAQVGLCQYWKVCSFKID